MARRTHSEIAAENLVLFRELESIRDRLDELLGEPDDEDPEDDGGDEATDDAEDED